MLSKEDLEAIGILVRTEVDALREDMVTKDDIEGLKAYIKTNNNVISALVKVDLASKTTEIVEAVKAGFQETIKQIKRVERKLDEKLADHKERIQGIEKELHSSKN